MVANAAPLVLGSQLTITRGQTLRFASIDLAPKVLVPYEVNAIRMLAYPSIETPAVALLGATSALKGFLKWQFQVGNFLPLTDSFVPMWNMMPVQQTMTQNGGYYEWRFKKPLLLRPGARIDAQVQLSASTPNSGATPTVTVALSYAGRLRGDLSSLPSMIDVPFVSAWDSIDTGGQVANDPNTMRNPLRTSVEVDYLIGQVLDTTTGLQGDTSTELQVFSPDGRTVHQAGPIQFHALFPTDTAAFPFVGTVPVNTHFQVRLSTAPSASYRPQVSYIGSRRERLP